MTIPHVPNIRRLLGKSFNIDELILIIHDVPEFNKVEDELGRNDPEQVIVDKLIDYAKRNGRIDLLLDTVQRLRPVPFEKYRPYYRDDGRPARRSLEVLLYETAGQVLYKPEVLFGRDALRRSVHGLLDEGRQVLLYGSGGMGKTALATTIASERIDDGQGPVIWLEMGRGDADAVSDALARRFATAKKQAEISVLTGSAKVFKVGELLERVEAGLLVLDDVWDGTALRRVLEAVPDRLPVLVTSRQRFPLKEMRELDELVPESGLELLSHVAKVDYRLDADARALCEELGWHAYAIEIAGTSLRVYGLSPAKLSARIADAPHDVPMPAGFAEEGRESVKELLDASVEALDKEARKVFLTFGGLFVPRATPTLLVACSDQQPAMVLRQLLKLMERSLVKCLPDTDFYYLHDLTGSYAREMFESGGQDRRETVAAVARYADEHVRDLGLLGLDQDNLLEAASAGRTDDVEALKTIMSVLATGGYMDARGHTPIFLALLDDAIAAVKLEGEEGKETLHYLLGKRGNAHFDRGELQQAYEVYQESLELAPNDSRRVMLLAALGKVRSEQKEYDESDDYFERGTRLAEANGDLRALAFLLRTRSFAVGRRGDFEAARDFAASALQLCRRPGMRDPVGLGYSLLLLGSSEFEAGIHRALSFHQQACEIAQAEGVVDLVATALYGQGCDYHALYRYEDAQQRLAEARRLFRECGNTAKEAEVTELIKKYGYSME